MSIATATPSARARSRMVEPISKAVSSLKALKVSRCSCSVTLAISSTTLVSSLPDVAPLVARAAPKQSTTSVSVVLVGEPDSGPDQDDARRAIDHHHLVVAERPARRRGKIDVHTVDDEARGHLDQAEHDHLRP